MRIISFLRYGFLALFLLSVAAPSFAQIGISVSFGPPPIPFYEQPICPGDDYIWTPGYWASDGIDYYWVPGTWVMAPEVGFFWTPGYWGWGGTAFFFHEGYWGPHVGFYGGINYGFGYFGRGYEGGRWDGGRFFYNRSVNNVNVNVIHNVYNTRISYNNTNRVSYNGGNGGINARATSREAAFSRERHISPVAAQTQHVEGARANRELRASVNQGRPPIAATQRPGAFNAQVVSARDAGGRYKPPANRGANSARTTAHPNALPPLERPAAPNTGNPKLDQKYQQQQQKLYTRQNQERQKVQQQHEREHQMLAKQNANQARTQQVEQRHQQQTQQMQQRHVQQQQQMQQRQQPSSRSESRPGRR
jgi:hypothetical protein